MVILVGGGCGTDVGGLVVDASLNNKKLWKAFFVEGALQR